LIVIVLLTAGVFAGTSLLAQDRFDAGPDVDGQLLMPDLSAPVTVLRDNQGIPYIFADNTAGALRSVSRCRYRHAEKQTQAWPGKEVCAWSDREKYVRLLAT